MAIGTARVKTSITLIRRQHVLGPFDYDVSYSMDEGARLDYEVSNNTTLQLIGGVSPQISEITSVNLLHITADQDILVGLEGNDPAVTAWTIYADKMATLGPGVLITEVAIRNESGSTANVTVIIEGT